MRRRIVVALTVLAIFGTVAVIAWRPWRGTGTPVSRAGWQQEGKDRYLVERGRTTAFNFDGISNRVFVPEAPVFDFGANQDFAMEAWIRACPPTSKLAQRFNAWSAAHPFTAPLLQRLRRWLKIYPRRNDFGVMPIVDKHQTPNVLSAVGFLLYLDSGKLGCMLSDSLTEGHRAVFVSPGPNLQDDRWHHVAMSIKRDSATGGRLYVDGQRVLTFDPTGQAGDLSNREPLRIGNHANPSLQCFFYGQIDHVVLYRHTLRTEEAGRSYSKGRFK